MRLILTLFLLAPFSSIAIAQANPRSIKGFYRNPAEGYAIRIPKSLNATAGDQAGPERGVSIRLPSGNTILTIGEPNSADYKTTREGVRADLEYDRCHPQALTITATNIGKLKGSRGRLVCGNHVHIKLLAFRPGGEPIYWLDLITDLEHEAEDAAILQSIASSFSVIRWE